MVDELHTFDGAQGTDLACLIRRLRVRLGAKDDLICVGTSATLGEEGQEGKLLDYVSAVFKADFDADAIVGESRQGIDEFLGETLITDVLTPHSDLAGAADPARFGSSEDYVRSVHELFFQAVASPEDSDAEGWRVALADRLRGHSGFVNLLRVLDGRPRPLGEVMDQLRPSLPVSNDGEALLVLNALCALISVARRREGNGEGTRLRPFLQRRASSVGAGTAADGLQRPSRGGSPAAPATRCGTPTTSPPKTGRSTCPSSSAANATGPGGGP